jgi:hypothetical protein
VDAFISHSQLDDDACKWEVLRDWARSFEQRHQRAPTIWYDRVCIEGASAAESIATLPLMVMGCKQLVVLAGPTYSSRLWALVEVLVFLWSQQGSSHDIDVLPLLWATTGCRSPGTEMVMLRNLRRVDLAAAVCYCEEDRQWMLAAIESAFGTPCRLNTLLSNLLLGKYCRQITQQRSASPASMDELPAAAVGCAAGASRMRIIAWWRRAAGKDRAEDPPGIGMLALPPELLTFILHQVVCLESLHARQPRLGACTAVCKALQLLSSPLYQSLTEATLETMWNKMRMSGGSGCGGRQVSTLEEARVIETRGNLVEPELMLTRAESRLLASQFEFRHQTLRTTLRELHLIGQQQSFGDSGLFTLSEALLSSCEPTQLRVLRLRNAGISDLGASVLALVLAPEVRGGRNVPHCSRLCIAPLKHLHSLMIHDNKDLKYQGIFDILAAVVIHIRRWGVTEQPSFHLDLKPAKELVGIYYSFLVERAMRQAGHDERLYCEYSFESLWDPRRR